MRAVQHTPKARQRLRQNQFPHMAVGKRELGEVEWASAFEIIEQENSPFEYFLIFRYPIIDGIFGREMGAIRKHGPAQRALLRE